MRVLIVKTSSMGDVIHTLPALTDAGHAIPGITFDWVVEENFAAIPLWHPLVKNVIPVAWRRWRKNLFSRKTREEWRQFRQKLNAAQYDMIIDAQGLLKSAFFSRFAKGVRYGLDWQSSRESVASLFYQHTCSVARDQHAITRVRSLFSQALSYVLPKTVPQYGVDRERFLIQATHENPYLVFLHGTTWVTKHWPEKYWAELATQANQAGFLVKLPWGNQAELERAERIAAGCSRVEVLPRSDLIQMAKILAGAKAIVAVDTGLGHLAAALDVPMVSLYGPTNPTLTGALGQSQVHLSATFPCAPCLSKVCTYQESSNAKSLPQEPQCFYKLSPSVVWKALADLL